MDTNELDYALPAGCIATVAAEPRDAARLMVVHRATGRIDDRMVRDLGDPALGLLRAGDLLVFNATRVLPASFTATRRGTGGKVRGLYLASDANVWQVMLEARGSLRPGETLALAAEDATLELLEATGGGQWRARVHSSLNTLALLKRVGVTPLPPYIRQARKQRGEAEVTEADALRYNTVFAQTPGSVAAPTAALHFTAELLARLDAMGVQRATLTLHVGLGTFAPVRSERLEEHAMHAEWVRVPAATIAALLEARREGRRIIPVGTTCVRALESLPLEPDPSVAFVIDTNLFIRAGFAFRFADALLTNFHLPRSTLLALVAALPDVGIERLKAWYAHAIAHGYRFYSYGDAMLLV